MRYFLFFVLRWAGVFRLWQFLHRKEIIIFSLHGVMKEDGRSGWVPLWGRLSPDVLEDVLKYLLRKYSFITMDEAADILQGKIPARPYLMALTFDDGYRNFLTHALPVMEKYSVPSTVYITTSNTASGTPFFFDRLDYVIQKLKLNGESVLSENLSPLTLEFGDRNKLWKSYRRMIDMLRREPGDDFKFQKLINDIAFDLEKKTGSSLLDINENDDWSAILNWDEVRVAGKKGVSFGSHTVNHIRLGRVGEETARREVVVSKREIEKMTAVRCGHFCFPNGSFNRMAKKNVRKSGYRTAVTVERGACKVGDDLFSLKRYSFPYTFNKYELLNMVSGFSEDFKKIKSFFIRTKL